MREGRPFEEMERKIEAYREQLSYFKGKIWECESILKDQKQILFWLDGNDVTILDEHHIKYYFISFKNTLERLERLYKDASAEKSKRESQKRETLESQNQ